MNAKTLESENHCSQAGPLDLRDCVLRHALLPELGRVDPKTFASRSSSGPAGSLTRLAPVDGDPL